MIKSASLASTFDTISPILVDSDKLKFLHWVKYGELSFLSKITSLKFSSVHLKVKIAFYVYTLLYFFNSLDNNLKILFTKNNLKEWVSSF